MGTRRHDEVDHRYNFALMCGMIGLVVENGKCPVDLLCGHHSSKFMRQRHGTKTPKERRFLFIQGLICESVGAADYDLKDLNA